MGISKINQSFWFFVFISCLLSAQAGEANFSGNGKEKSEETSLVAQKYLLSLMKKENYVIHSYSGVLVNADMVFDKPNISADYVNVKFDSMPVTNIEPIFVIRGSSPDAEKPIVQEINNLANFKPAFMLEDDLDYDSKQYRIHGEKWVRFNYYDNHRVLRVSEWRDIETGFKMQSALYNEKGRLLGLSFYLRLHINQSGENIRVTNLFVENLARSQKYKSLSINSIGDVRSFSNMALEKVFQTIGYAEH